MYRIGIDLGGINIAVGITDDEGKLLTKKSIKTREPGDNAEIITVKMAKFVLEIIKDFGITEDDVRSIGIGCPGAVNIDTGEIIYTPNLPYRSYNVREIFARYTKLPVYLGNDANCAALGEATAGGAKGRKSCVAVTLGTGVGGGVIIDGKIYSGFNCAAGELGHIVMHRGGRQCGCGRKGCLEAYASATALINDTKAAAEADHDSLIYKNCGGDLSKISGRSAFDAAQAGDDTAKKVVANYIEELGEGVIDFINIFQPEAILIGGGISNQGDTLLNPLRDYVFKYSYGANLLPRTEILKAELGNDAGIVGAAML